jgi:signal transduction histidine kinase
MKHTGDNPKLRPIVDEARRQASRIHLAINDLLAFARPKSPNRAPVDLNETVERALTLVRPTAESVGVSIDVELDKIPRVRADREMIRQSLVNLIMNGVQASSSGARVRVATRRAAQGVEIVIHDSGKGIPPEHLDQIFKPFFTTKHQGTGLGLSITRSVIEQHKGTITVESPPGKGTTFIVTLPIQGDSPGTDLT